MHKLSQHVALTVFVDTLRVTLLKRSIHILYVCPTVHLWTQTGFQEFTLGGYIQHDDQTRTCFPLSCVHVLMLLFAWLPFA